MGFETMNFSKTIFNAIIAGALTLLTACSGTMDGMIRGEGTRVTFLYSQGMVRDFYETTIDGEHFKGQAVYADARTGLGAGFADGTTISTISSSTSGNIVAVLFGDRGQTMRCHMNYADSSGITSAGGVGICQHSDGRVIDVMW